MNTTELRDEAQVQRSALVLAMRWIGSNSLALSPAYSVSARFGLDWVAWVPVVAVQGHAGTLTELVDLLGAVEYEDEDSPGFRHFRVVSASVRVEIAEER